MDTRLVKTGVLAPPAAPRKAVFARDGMIIATFTPLRGLTPFIDHYLETAELADATGHLVNAKLGLFGETIE